MELRKATHSDLMKVIRAIGYKDLPYITKSLVNRDYINQRLFVVAEGKQVFACVSLQDEPDYNYTAVKRLCILNKKNCGKGLARFALREIQKIVDGRIGATPWESNLTMCYLLESEGFHLEYKFDTVWCFYVKVL